MPRPSKTLPVSFRFLPEMKEALERAAKDDDRSTSAMVERILSMWLRENGYLPSAKTSN
ncbi:ribbon-helix-helix protein, CopG family [Roseomonas mucosa]|uniref:ribbon-helix-helix protein, CopG family n=1 Tax=Roseomonas mucosa TaxID=207340 RepID=UPI0036F4005A